MRCGERKENDEALLWEYYKGFTYAPELFDSLSSHARNPVTKDFLSGLKCFEKYSQDEKADCYDSAFDIFSTLMKEYPNNYVGHLGMGLLMTEKGMIEGENIYFDSAVQFYQSAYRANPKHAAIYYYRGRNEFSRNKSVINENAIRLLDTATQIKPDFFKAAERSARFLSHYLDLAIVSTNRNPLQDLKGQNDLEQKFNADFPQASDRVRYLFEQSLSIDPSWYETYQDIANAHHVYSAKERLDFLQTGISIAQKKKSKDSLQLIKNLANVYYYDLNDYESARNEYGRWILEYGGARDYVNLAWCQFFLGQPEAVPYLMQKAIELDKSGFSHFQYGLLQSESGEPQLAIEEFDKAIAEQKDSWRETAITKIEKAKMLLVLGKKTEATHLLKELDSQNPEFEEIQKAKALASSL